VAGKRDGVAADGSLAEISVYPFKGGRGLQPKSWPLEASGLQWDRRWMLVDADGQSVTQRSHSGLALIEPVLDSGALALTAPGFDAARLPVDPPSGGVRTKVRMEDEDVWVSSVAAEVDA